MGVVSGGRHTEVPVAAAQVAEFRRAAVCLSCPVVLGRFLYIFWHLPACATPGVLTPLDIPQFPRRLSTSVPALLTKAGVPMPKIPLHMTVMFVALPHQFIGRCPLFCHGGCIVYRSYIKHT